MLPSPVLRAILCGADGERVEAELIAEDDARGGAADRDVDNVADRWCRRALPCHRGFIVITGDAPQVPTQWSGGGAVAAANAEMQRSSRGHRARSMTRGSIAVLFEVGPVWVAEQSYRCFCVQARFTYSGRARTLLA